MKSHKSAVTRAFNAHQNGKGMMQMSGGKSTPQNMKTKHPKMNAKRTNK